MKFTDIKSTSPHWSVAGQQLKAITFATARNHPDLSQLQTLLAKIMRNGGSKTGKLFGQATASAASVAV